MKKKLQLAATAAFMVILILPSLAWGVLQLIARNDPGVMEMLDYDLGENRNKAPFPESFDLDEYTKQLEAYYNDRAPFRSVLIRWNQKFSGRLESVYQANVEPTLIEWMYGSSSQGNAQIPGLPAVLPDDLTGSGGNPGSITPSGSPAPPEGSGAAVSPMPPDGSGVAAASPAPSDGSPTAAPAGEAHNYLVAQQLAPTCEKEGSITYYCGHCGDTYTQTLPAAGHVPETKVVEPSYLNYGYTSYFCTVCGKTWRGNFVEKPIDNTYLPPKQAGDYVVFGRYNWLFYRGNSTIAYYRGANVLTEQEMAEYLATLQQLQDLCDEKGIRLCFMIIPNKEEVYDEYMPTYQMIDPLKRDVRLKAYITENSDIDFLYPLEELKTGKVCYDTYYMYDSHWNNAGGFLGAQALYRALEMPVTVFLDWSITETLGAPTGLVATGGLDPANYQGDHDYTIDYRPEVQLLKVEGEKNIFCSTGIYRAWSDCGNDQKLVLLGDSFRVAMLPYLERDFAEICVAHRDEKQKVIQDVREADVLVVSAVERFDRALFETAQALIGYLSE